MLSVWKLKEGAFEFSESEDKLIKWWLRTLIKECPYSCSFLNDLNLDNIKFKWAPNCNLDNGILGAWNVSEPDVVYICKYPEYSDHWIRPDGSSRSGCIKDEALAMRFGFLTEPNITNTIIHELIHKFQFHVSPVLYFINRLVTLCIDLIPYLNRIGIEYDARHNSSSDPTFTQFTKDFWETYSACHVAIGIKSPEDQSNNQYKQYRGLGDWVNNKTYPKYCQDLVDEVFRIINE